MKVFSHETSPFLGQKAENLTKLAALGKNLPETYIVHRGCFDSLSFESSLRSDIPYILRPSFSDEDGNETSLAGYFQSLFPLSKADVVAVFLQSDRFDTRF
jgi:hypothetical protein